MKKILANGLTVLCSISNNQEVSLTFKCGHVNEPKLGLAAVYENIVAQNSSNLGSVCGGSLTSFVTGVKSSITVAIKSLFDNCYNTAVTPKALKNAIADIVKHTRDLAPLPKRQSKLAYKHAAFGKNEVFWKPEDYISRLSELTVADVKDYIASNFVGRNLVISYRGHKEDFETVVEIAERYFGSLDKGKRAGINLEYTGGFSVIEGNGALQLALFGWDISKGCNTAEVNVLLSLLSGRMERSLGEAGLSAESEVKIAGYFGLRTLRIGVSCASKSDFNKCITIVCDNVKRLQLGLASDRRMETSRQRAMTERLAISNEALPRSVEAAWALLGRNIDYDNDRAIANIWEVSASDVRYAAQDIFSKKMTCVLYTNKPYPTEDAILKAMSPEPKVASAPEKPAFSESERAVMERVDALNAE